MRTKTKRKPDHKGNTAPCCGWHDPYCPGELSVFKFQDTGSSTRPHDTVTRPRVYVPVTRKQLLPDTADLTRPMLIPHGLVLNL
ncbi:hypothetical protein HanRHA438_Chr04g0177781 [Helianthus annuus]|nr:hypothetical protein HanRHA438_Chr04g0177781 [Helianthus annuus]